MIERSMAALAAENAPDAANTLDEYRDQAVRIGAALTDISSDIRVVRLLLIEAASVDTDQRACPVRNLALAGPSGVNFDRHFGVSK